MRNPIVAFNRWYDQVGEPWRLLGCLVLCAPLCLLGYFPQYMVEILIYTAGLIGMRVWWVEIRPVWNSRPESGMKRKGYPPNSPPTAPPRPK